MRVLLTGAGGQLGQDLRRAFGDGIKGKGRSEVVAATRAELDLADRDQVLQAITALRPDVVVNAGAWTAVDACESDPDRAFAVNALGCRWVAEGCRRAGAHLVHVSTDYVFDGAATTPYKEWDPVGPISVYGRSKLGGEQEILAGLPGATIVRTSWLCGAGGPNFVKTMLRLAGDVGNARVVEDQRGCPTFTDDLAGMIGLLAARRIPGIFHVTNQGETTWYALAAEVFRLAGSDPGAVVPIKTSELSLPAPRPPYSVLDNSGLRLAGIPLLPDHHEPLARLVSTLMS